MSASTSATIRLIDDQNVITSFNRGPITSIFAHPASCTATLTFSAKKGGSSGDLYFGHFSQVFDKACFPANGDGQAPGGGTSWRAYYYSPAICPSGWTVVTTFRSSAPIFPSPSFIAVGPETTAELCCPSGYSYFGFGHQCSSTVSADQTITIFSVAGDGLSVSLGTPKTWSGLTATKVMGDGIPIMYQQKDADVLSRASALTPTVDLSTITSPPSISTINSIAATNPISTTITVSGVDEISGAPNPSKLSTGAKIGIGVGVPIAVLLGLLLGFLIWRKRQVHRKNGVVYELEQEGVKEYDNNQVASAYHASQAVHEVQGIDDRRHELEGVSAR